MQTLEQISFFHMTYLFLVEFEKKEVFNRVIEKFIIGRLLNLKVLKKKGDIFSVFPVVSKKYDIFVYKN